MCCCSVPQLAQTNGSRADLTCAVPSRFGIMLNWLACAAEMSSSTTTLVAVAAALRMSPGSKCSSILPMTLARTVPSGCLWTSVLAAMRLGSPVEVHVEGAAAGERRAVGAGHVHHRGH